MSVTFKPGVRFDVIAPAGFTILEAIKSASLETGLDLVITSGTEGDHSGPEDPHKTGEAYDVRTRMFTREQKQYVFDSIMSWLDSTQFYGVIEDVGGPNEHAHFQRRKGTEFGIEEFLHV